MVLNQQIHACIDLYIMSTAEGFHFSARMCMPPVCCTYTRKPLCVRRVGVCACVEWGGGVVSFNSRKSLTIHYCVAKRFYVRCS